MGGRPSMVMQWYDKGCAAEYLKGPGLGVNRMSLIYDVTQGLNYLHTLSPPIVHGDLKGNNVLITNEGHAVLSDFGLSKVIEDLVGPTGYTPSSPEVGPLRWQAPEFVEDEKCKLGLETDVWSFGCTAYELLTNYTPYYYRTKDALIMRDMREGIKPPGPDGMSPFTQDERVITLLYDACWSFSPSSRLQMSTIVLQVGEICANPKAIA
ncbi:kinase-like domain-containing protein [Collybia nuda]|uniref:Kinase-like domain-containing protein n=1 Tax=Collybia nuda TaxID=64659 RepID=A0A9P5Y2E6_9AGAR|nr:kinase-like domain-containing protein [Collybia nuda]